MTRPVRIEFSGAIYHVTSRGDRREAIYEDDEDRERFLRILGEVVRVWNWTCHAFCLMTNHYHLVIETPDGNLSKGMRQLNGVYTQASNRRHGRVGHLFQGRYKAVLVDGDAYLLELTRYVVLNPVRARMVKHPGEWIWSSYQAMTGQSGALPWMATDGLLAQFSTDRIEAVSRYIQFVDEGMLEESIWTHLNRQIFLGGDRIINHKQAMHENLPDTVGVPRAQRHPSLWRTCGLNTRRLQSFPVPGSHRSYPRPHHP